MLPASMAAVDRDVGIGEAQRQPRRPGRIAQLGHVEPRDLEEVGVIEQALRLEDIAFRQLEAFHQSLAHALIRAGGEVDAHHRLEAPLAQRVGHDVTQAVAVVVFELNLGIAQDAEQRRRYDLHARKELEGVVPDQVLEPDEHALARRHVALEGDPRCDLGRES